MEMMEPVGQSMGCDSLLLNLQAPERLKRELRELALIPQVSIIRVSILQSL